MKYSQSVTMVLAFLLMTANVQAQEVDYVQMGEKGIEAFQKGDIVTAMELLERSAKQGYAPAQATLAYLLDKSDFDVQALQWYEKSANQGNADGQYGLAGLYANGEGVKKDSDVALRWLLKAVEQNHKLATRMYAHSLEAGYLDLQKDEKKALALYRQCHDAGEMSCTRRLSRAYRNGELGLAIDETIANKLYSKINSSEGTGK